MPRADRPTLAQLRKLAREALGPFAELELYQRWQDPAFYAEVTAPGQSVKGDGVDTWEARRQLRALLTAIVAGRTAQKREAAFAKLNALTTKAVQEPSGMLAVGRLPKITIKRTGGYDPDAERAPRRRATNGAARRKT